MRMLILSFGCVMVFSGFLQAEDMEIKKRINIKDLNM